MHIPSLILREQVQRAGWPGLVAALLLVLALGYALLGLLPAWQALENLQRNSQQASDYLAQIESGTAQLPRVPTRELDDFHRTLPAQLDATSAIDRIYELAAQEHITLDRGEYSLGIDPKTRLARYQILLPVRGSYMQLRGFLHALLNELPAVVLEDLDFQRKDIADSELSGRIRMTLYLSRS